MRKFDVMALAVILAVAAGLRLWAPWDDVLGGSRVNFLETDAWYHVRLAESQVRNFPHRVTVDPYASPDGQYVAVAPLLDTVIATVAFVTAGRDASTEYIERVAAIVPALIGVLAVAAVWALATIAFDRRAGLIAGLLAAVLPGHFLDRTLVGFVDHHALEVLLSFATLACIAYGSAIGAGILLGLYLLAWASGSYFVSILALWIVMTALAAPKHRAEAARFATQAGVIALAVVIAFQDPGLFRYGSQIAALAGLILISVTVYFFSDHLAKILGIAVAASAVVVGVTWLVMPDLVTQVMSDVSRFRPDPTRMAVLEARPLFMYQGNWTWMQPWIFFRIGFYAGLVAVAALAFVTWRTRRVDHILILCFTIANYLATIGQNRFGYYLVPSTAVVIAWLAVRVLDWGGVPHAGNPAPKIRQRLPFQRELAVIVVAGVVIAPNLMPAALTTTRAGGMPQYWFDAMEWLKTKTPEPFASPGYYLGPYGKTNPQASYTIMNWWDQGYWIVQTAHRVPVSNPTQNNAPEAASFLTATDESAALEILARHRAKYALLDFELPFRDGADGSLQGRFQNLADWAGIPTSRFYSLCFSRRNESEGWQPTWIYREAYYQSMAYRLMVLGGGAVDPANNTWVVQIQERTDTSGRRFCEVANRWQYGRAEEAKLTAKQRGPGFEAVGLTPWYPAFAVPAIAGLKVAAEFRDPGQKEGETPMVRIFEVASSK
ncbi:MAG TPA: STT3 domain-containing protein [Vicinamibacterales bacterium]|nr:STT3 domain-containing protein [Vicinamibacterales bacterium]